MGDMDRPPADHGSDRYDYRARGFKMLAGKPDLALVAGTRPSMGRAGETLYLILADGFDVVGDCLASPRRVLWVEEQ